MESTKNYNHPLYKHCKESEAEAIAWAFLNPTTFEKFPYKLPELADDEIRATILYVGLCLSDSLDGRSRWGESLITYPLAPGHEIVGVVERVGKSVTDFKKGDKVAFGFLRDCCEKCKMCLRNKETLCLDETRDKFTYGQHWGGYSTHLQQPAKFFFKLPDSLDLLKAPPLLCAGITVYNPIKQYLQPGDKCAVIGVGGLGHMAVQFLSKMGHEVTAVTNSMDRENFYKSLGATDAIDISNEEVLKKNQKRFDFIINTVPSSGDFENFLSLTAPNGYFVQLGIPDIKEKISFSPFGLVWHEYHLVGSLVGSRRDIKEMFEFCAKHNVYPIVEEYGFDEFPKALERLESGKAFFRCIVNVGDYCKKKGFMK